MTIEELREFDAAPPDRDKAIVAWRYRPGYAPPGARVDVKCEICGHRVTLAPSSCELLNAGAHAVCRECFMRAFSWEALQQIDPVPPVP